MRSKFLLGLVVMLLMAVPAMAAPLMFNFNGNAVGTVNGNAFDGPFSISILVETTAMGSGLYGGTIPVNFYSAPTPSDPTGHGILSESITFGAFSGTITDALYIANSPGDPANGIYGAIGVGLWDGTQITTPTLPFIGDVYNAWAPDVLNIQNPFGPIVTDIFLLAGAAFNTSFGLVTLDGPGLLRNGIYDNQGVPIADPVYFPVAYGAGVNVPTIVPEPSMMLLFGAGLLGLGALRKKI